VGLNTQDTQAETKVSMQGAGRFFPSIVDCAITYTTNITLWLPCSYSRLRYKIDDTNMSHPEDQYTTK
jgi:hypothetical protein